ncbi:MAG: family 43 glycosylhydrolase [Actinobacteria bacterium]|nr:family 43 glycosylhydrolase [Actinomycetota bacterium]
MPSTQSTLARRSMLVKVLLLIGLSLFAGLISAPPAGAKDPNDAQPGQRLPTRGPVKSSSVPKAERDVNLVDGLLRGVPIVEGDFADPFALAEPDALYIYATNTVDANIPVIRIRKNQLFKAQYLGDALPTLPSWTVKGFQWAPSVWAAPGDSFVMYYTTPSSGGLGNKQCISRATSTDPAGPFVDNSTEAFICPLSEGGAIDASIFVDTDDVLYLIWKSDGNCCNLPTVIYSQPLTSDGLSVAGPPVELITASQPWEDNLVEGPSMIRKGATYYLFYSANQWDTTDYAIGAATCTSVSGPCTKPEKKPWMDSGTFSKGPGGQEFFESAGKPGVWMVHHGWLPNQAGTPGGQRRLYLDKLGFQQGDTLPTRTGKAAAAEALVQDALIVGLVLAAIIGLWFLVRSLLRRRKQKSAA